MLKTKTKNTKEEYRKASSAIGLLGLLSLLRDFEEREEFEECAEIYKALKDIKKKYNTDILQIHIPLNLGEVKEEDLLRVGRNRKEQIAAIKNQKQRLKVWLAK